MKDKNKKDKYDDIDVFGDVEKVGDENSFSENDKFDDVDNFDNMGKLNDNSLDSENKFDNTDENEDKDKFDTTTSFDEINKLEGMSSFDDIDNFNNSDGLDNLGIFSDLDKLDNKTNTTNKNNTESNDKKDDVKKKKNVLKNINFNNIKIDKRKMIIFSVIIIFLSLLLFVMPRLFILKVNGKKTVKVEVGSKYKELGATALALGRKIKVNTSGNVNVKKIGTYAIKYNAKFLVFNKTVERKVKVVDTEKPIIKLKGAKEVVIKIGEDYQEEGCIVSDNYDKTKIKHIKVSSTVDKSKVGTYEIEYSIEDSSHNKASVKRIIKVVAGDGQTSTRVGTYINDILIVNKKYPLPADYNPGVDPAAYKALEKLQNGGLIYGFKLPLISGFRSYSTQEALYNNYVAKDGVEKANTYSARPGQSEHQSGLAFDIGKLDDKFGDTAAGNWLAKNAHKYGFIIRYLKGKEAITGYQYEPWHIRYVGEKVATEIYKKGITLEEYLGVA